MHEPVESKDRAVELVLFDLDGTFADTAPDMAYALNRTLERNGRSPLPLETIRPHVSHGGVALIRLGFGIEPNHPEFAGLRQQFLDLYRDNLARGTTLFAGIEPLLTHLEERGIGWGIVTNKPGWLTEPLMRQLALDSRAACVVSGDTTANSKPHPEPILYACELLGAAPQRTLYVGDRVERLYFLPIARRIEPAPPAPPLVDVRGVFLLDVAGIRKHGPAQVSRGAGGPDGPLETVLDQRRQIPRMVDMRVGQDDGVHARAGKRQVLVPLPGLLAPPLEHSAV